MVEHSFDIGWGVHSVAPNFNQKIIPQREYNERLARNLAEYNKMSIEEVKEYMYG